MLCTIGNFDVTAQTGSFTFPSAGTWYDYLNGNTIAATGLAQNISLQPGEFHVYLNRNLVNAVVTAVTDIIATGNNLLVNVYPNPVQSNSVIDANIPENGKVQINLLNTLGQKTAIIYSGFLTKGKHQLLFNKDVMNLPSGNYLLQVESKNKTNTVKLVF
jgi:hypothetical protein